MTAVQFTSPTEGWVVGGVPCGGYGVTQCPWYVAHTDDGGRTWHPPSDATLNRFAFGEGIACAGDTCIVVNDTFKAGRVSVTSDGGASWRQTQEVSAVLNAIGCSPDGRSCVVVGREGSLLAATAG